MSVSAVRSQKKLIKSNLDVSCRVVSGRVLVIPPPITLLQLLGKQVVVNGGQGLSSAESCPCGVDLPIVIMFT